MPDIKRHAHTSGRAGWLDYARILRWVHDGVDTATKLSMRLRASQEAVREILCRMCALDLVHISGREEVATHSRMRMPTWAIGPSVGPVNVRGNLPKQANIELIAFNTMVRALQARGMSVRDLAMTAGLNKERVRRLLRVCTDELKCMHVVRWSFQRAVPGGSRTAIYAWGFDCESVRCPPARDREQINAADRARRLVALRRRERLVAMSPHSSIFRLAA